MNQKSAGDSVRAGCGDKPHVRFGRGRLMLLSHQDLASYLTFEPENNPAHGEGPQSLQEETSGNKRTKTYVRYHQNPTKPRHQGKAQSNTQIRPSLPAYLPGRVD